MYQQDNAVTGKAHKTIEFLFELKMLITSWCLKLGFSAC